MKEHQRPKDLQRPAKIDGQYLYGRLRGQLSSIGFKTRRGYDLSIDLEWIYNQSIAVILDLNTFLETVDSNPDAALDAIAGLNEDLHDLSYHMRSSRRTRQRLQVHIAGLTLEGEDGS